MKLLISLTVLLLVAIPSVASQEKNYFAKSETCFKTQDIQKVSNHFQQFQKFANYESEEICQGQGGLTAQWTDVVRSVLVLQRIHVKPILRDKDDDFTRRAIEEKDWWAYFKQRANSFAMTKCGSGVVAYVYGILPGQIFLCEPFFKKTVAGQLDTLMHEVRHFDGYGHVDCTRGSQKGARRACDESIKGKGSYAISVQTAVEMSFVSQLSKEERAASEAAAIFSMYNRFNRLPVIKSEDKIYLSHRSGDIYKLAVSGSKEGELELVTTLDGPAQIYSNSAAITVYPVDPKNEAYRISRHFEAEIARRGAFADLYNEAGLEERKGFVAVNYSAGGAIIQGETLYTFCDKDIEGLSNKKFTRGKIQALVSLKNENNEDDLYIMIRSGQLYKVSCEGKKKKLLAKKEDNKKELVIKKSRKKFPKNIKESFSLGGAQYALNGDGDIVELTKKGRGRYFESRSVLEGMDLLSATPLQDFNVFEKDKIVPQRIIKN